MSKHSRRQFLGAAAAVGGATMISALPRHTEAGQEPCEQASPAPTVADDPLLVHVSLVALVGEGKKFSARMATCKGGWVERRSAAIVRNSLLHAVEWIVFCDPNLSQVAFGVDRTQVTGSPYRPCECAGCRSADHYQRVVMTRRRQSGCCCWNYTASLYGYGDKLKAAERSEEEAIGKLLLKHSEIFRPGGIRLLVSKAALDHWQPTQDERELIHAVADDFPS